MVEIKINLVKRIRTTKWKKVAEGRKSSIRDRSGRFKSIKVVDDTYSRDVFIYDGYGNEFKITLTSSCFNKKCLPKLNGG